MRNMEDASNGQHKLLWVILAIKKEINAKTMQIPRGGTGLFKSNQRHDENSWRHQVWTLGWDFDKMMLNPFEWFLWQFLLNRAVQSGEFSRGHSCYLLVGLCSGYFLGVVSSSLNEDDLFGRSFKSRTKITCTSKCHIFSSLFLPPSLCGNYNS